MSNTNPFPEGEQLPLIPMEEMPHYYEVEGKGVALAMKPQFGKRVTMVITGIVDQVGVKRTDHGNEAKFKFKADRCQFIDPGTVVEATNARMLEQLEDFITADDFDALEVSAAAPPPNIDPETGEIIKPDDDIDGDFGPSDD